MTDDIRKARDLVTIWTDASRQSKSKVGGGFVIQGNMSGFRVAAFPLSLTTRTGEYLTGGVKVAKSTDAELWTALVALENAEPDSVIELVTDSMFSVSRISEILASTLNERAHYGPLYSRLKAAIGKQPFMKVRHTGRDTENIPIADELADAAATDNREVLECLKEGLNMIPPASLISCAYEI